MFSPLLLLICCCASAMARYGIYYDPEDAHMHFENFIEKFNKQYASEEEKAERFETFRRNLMDINYSNSRNDITVFGITMFSDLSREEFLQRYTGLNSQLLGLQESHLCPYVYRDEDIQTRTAPASWDWRDYGVYSPVKSQGNSNSCYAFSTTGNIESQYAMKYKSHILLSEQQIIECLPGNGYHNGGLPSIAMMGLQNMGGIEEEDTYKFRGPPGPCQFDRRNIVVRVTGCKSFDLKYQDSVKEVLYRNGPIAISINCDALRDHLEDIMTDEHCRGKINHGVLLVGYGTALQWRTLVNNWSPALPKFYLNAFQLTLPDQRNLVRWGKDTDKKCTECGKEIDEKGRDYWIAKNSWGEAFGDRGYFRMQRSSTNPFGACGMLNNQMVSAIIQ